jgi:plastocyanin
MPMTGPRPTAPRALAVAASLAVALTLAACGGGGDDASGDDGGTDGGNAGLANDETTTTAAGSANSDVTLPEEIVDLTGSPAEVRAIDNTFDAEGVRVPAGTTIRWTNAGRQDHDVVPVGETEPETWGADIDAFHPGDTYEHTFTEPGTYNYYCTIHGTEAKGMVGVVVVE